MHNNESITSVNFHGPLTNSHCARFGVKAQLSGGFEDKLDEKLSLSEDQRIRRPSSRGPRLGIVIGPKSRMELPPSPLSHLLLRHLTVLIVLSAPSTVSVTPGGADLEGNLSLNASRQN